MNRSINLLVALLFFYTASCQTKDDAMYLLSTETIRSKVLPTPEKKSVVGVSTGKLIIDCNRANSSDSLLLYNEEKDDATVFEIASDTSTRVASILVKERQVVKKGFMSIPEHYKHTNLLLLPIDSFRYQDVWIDRGGVGQLIDKFPFHVVDKFYKVNFSLDANYLIINPYTDVSAGYWAEYDDHFFVYDLTKINAAIERQTIKCDQCLNVNIAGESIFFVKEVEIGSGRDGFYKNIYVSPRSNINDTVKIAQDINLIQLSPDANFILGEKYLHGQHVPVIIDVRTKRFQYILGRSYPLSKSFYSPSIKKFAFDFGTHFIYIDFPKTYPFDALKNPIDRNSKAENEEFWKKFRHLPIK